jgi:hypothetical protein
MFVGAALAVACDREEKCFPLRVLVFLLAVQLVYFGVVRLAHPLTHAITFDVSALVAAVAVLGVWLVRIWWPAGRPWLKRSAHVA